MFLKFSDIKKNLFDKISKQINKIKKIGIRKCFKKHILTSKQIGLDELKPNQLDLKFLFWVDPAQPV